MLMFGEPRKLDSRRKHTSNGVLNTNKNGQRKQNGSKGDFCVHGLFECEFLIAQ